MSIVFKGLHCSYQMNKQETLGTYTAVPCIRKKERENWAKSTLLAQN